MRYLMIILAVLLFLNASADRIDINNTAYDALDTLLVPDEVIENIKVYLTYHGPLTSIYELRDIEGVDSELFDILKRSIAVYPDTTVDSTSIFVIRMQERLASEESPTSGAIDMWEDMLISKMDINKASLNDLLRIEGVGITDAVAIIKSRATVGRFTYDNQIRRSPGLTYYSWTRLRNYVGYNTEEKPFDFSGYFRTSLRYTNDDTYNYSTYSALTNAIDNAITRLEVNHPDTVNTRDRLLEAGVSEEDIDSIKARLITERDELSEREKDGDIVNKMKLRFGKYAGAGILLSKYSGIEKYNAKGYVNIKNLPFIDNIFLGNYRVTLGQGLIMDNTDEYRARRLDIIEGLYSDMTESYSNAFTGGAIEGSVWRFGYLAFGSMTERDAVLNPDGTVNTLILTRTDLSAFENKVKETAYGGRLSFDMGGIGFLPLSTEIGVSGYRSLYDRNFAPDTLYIDIPFDKDNLNTPVYTAMFRGDTRTIIGMDFRTDIKNTSLEGEIAMMDTSFAYTVRYDINFNNFYVRTAFRHYDLAFDNPYARPFSEQGRFDDTVLEKDYRLVDPIFTMLTEDPRPKPEEGLYIETRYRMTEQFTITKAYLDLWKTLDHNLFNYRFQGEVEYRPVFPLRLRFKQKIQEKNLYKAVAASHSVTSESTFRAFAILTNNDYLNFEARYGKVILTPTSGYVEDYTIDGSYVNVSLEHKITDYFSVISGIAAWKTEGMSQWIFEDTGIDFLYGDGYKYYISIIDRISDNVSIRGKISMKDQNTPFTGIYSLDNELRYADSELTALHDFVDYQNIFNLNLQVDIRW